ncbi:MAG TPA: Spy/CpxP family protein refolding chaperone [Alphaproteobacteria bacterium]|nr:Spy/CpxP family protein refolding chaperone [Alphaproteobacteria bacterium]
MRKAIVSGLILAGLAGGIAAPSLVAAQTAAPDAAAQAPAPAAPAPQRPERHHSRPSERIDARLAYLKTALKITPAQEKQWAALAAVLRRQAQDMDAKMQQRREARQSSDQAQTQPSAIERLEQRQQFLADAAKRTGAVVAAAKPLYASFSPEQKQTADEMLAHSGHHFRHGWR